MKYYVIATRDIVADLYGAPMYVPSIGQAVRSFGDECQRQDPNNMMAKHPADFELYQLGTYDDHTGEFANDKKQIAVGANYRTTVQ